MGLNSGRQENISKKDLKKEKKNTQEAGEMTAHARYSLTVKITAITKIANGPN